MDSLRASKVSLNVVGRFPSNFSFEYRSQISISAGMSFTKTKYVL